MAKAKLEFPVHNSEVCSSLQKVLQEAGREISCKYKKPLLKMGNETCMEVSAIFTATQECFER